MPVSPGPSSMSSSFFSLMSSSAVPVVSMNQTRGRSSRPGAASKVPRSVSLSLRPSKSIPYFLEKLGASAAGIATRIWPPGLSSRRSIVIARKKASSGIGLFHWTGFTKATSRVTGFPSSSAELTMMYSAVRFESDARESGAVAARRIMVRMFMVFIQTIQTHPVGKVAQVEGIFLSP